MIKKQLIHTGQWFLMCLLLVAAVACTDEDWTSGKAGVIDENGMVSLTLNPSVPGLKLSRSVDQNGEEITSLWVLAFNEEGYMISRVLADQSNTVSGTNGGAGTFTAKVPGFTRRIHFLANVNMDNFSDQNNIGRHENEVIAPLLSSSGNLVYWGRRIFNSQDELTSFAADSKQNPVLLYRNQALVQYKLNNSNLEVDGWAVCNQYAFGTVAPFNATATDPFAFDLGANDFVTTLPEASRVKQRDDSEVSKASDEEGDPRYIFENRNVENDQVYLIMKIRKNNGSWKWYKIMLVNDQKVPYQIIRNHRYIVSISDINEAYGVNSFEAAKNATPANNPWITISDEIPEVVNGNTTLRIEGETTVVYQKAGDYTVNFYYDGNQKPKVQWLSNDGVAADIADTDVVWNSQSHEGSITLHVNTPAEGVITYGTFQVKEADGVLSRRVKVLLTEPFSFNPVWISSEIPLLDGENITVLFDIPENFPEELLPVDVKFACDLIDAQTGETNALKVITENTVYTVPQYNTETGKWEDAEITLDWNYKYVYSAATRGQHKVNFRTILTSLGSSVNTDKEFHIYMEGDDSRNGQDLFKQRDLFFAFRPQNDERRILLNDGDSDTKYASQTISGLNPVYGETITIPFTLGTLGRYNSITPQGSVDSEIWVYYDPLLVSPSWTDDDGAEDYFGNHYVVYKTTQAENELNFTTISPNFDCHIVLSAKSKSGYGNYYEDINNANHSLGVNENNNAFRSAAVTIHSIGRFDFNSAFSIDGQSFTPVGNGESFNQLPYGTGQHLWLRIDIPEVARDRAFQFKLGTKYLEPVDKTQWKAWTTAEGDGWTYTLEPNEAQDGTKIFEFQTTRLVSEETLSLASGPYIGFNPLAVDIVNPNLRGTIKLPDGVEFLIGSPYIILERATDGTRIGTFDLGEADLTGKTEASYELALRGEYNLAESDRINVKWSPVGRPEVYIYSALLGDIMKQNAIIQLQEQ